MLKAKRSPAVYYFFNLKFMQIKYYLGLLVYISIKMFNEFFPQWLFVSQYLSSNWLLLHSKIAFVFRHWNNRLKTNAIFFIAHKASLSNCLWNEKTKIKNLFIVHKAKYASFKITKYRIRVSLYNHMLQYYKKRWFSGTG